VRVAPADRVVQGPGGQQPSTPAPRRDGRARGRHLFVRESREGGGLRGAKRGGTVGSRHAHDGPEGQAGGGLEARGRGRSRRDHLAGENGARREDGRRGGSRDGSAVRASPGHRRTGYGGVGGRGGMARRRHVRRVHRRGRARERMRRGRTEAQGGCGDHRSRARGGGVDDGGTGSGRAGHPHGSEHDRGRAGPHRGGAPHVSARPRPRRRGGHRGRRRDPRGHTVPLPGGETGG
jgi:hypothetical protein